METRSPPAVEVVRGDRLECLHRAAAVACDAEGRIVFAIGDPHREILPRSGLKPFQSLARVELRLDADEDARDHEAEELAISCSSHSAEPGHVRVVERWLARMGRSEDDLACGRQIPYDKPVAKALFLSGREETRLHNNCSGKHAGMIATCTAMRWPVDGYVDPAHPLQERIAATLAEITGETPLGAPAIDGCSAPTWSMPLAAAARAFARLADPAALPPARRAAAERVFAAMRAHPWMVGGTDRTCTDFLSACPDTVVKLGAEGFYGIALRRRGLGIAVKVDDGAERASQVAAGAILTALDAVAPEAADAVERWTHQKLLNAAGDTVGIVRPTAGWMRGIVP